MNDCLIPRRTFVALALGGIAAPSLAQAVTGAHATRSANLFAQLEDELLRAMQRRDVPRLNQLLAEDFEMTVAPLPLDSIAREEWIDNLSRSGSTKVAVQSLTARELSPDLAQVSLWLVPQPATAGRGKVFVLDTWKREGEQWKLLTRHAAPVAGSRLWIPGDSGRAPFRKMI